MLITSKRHWYIGINTSVPRGIVLQDLAPYFNIVLWFIVQSEYNYQASLSTQRKCQETKSTC